MLRALATRTARRRSGAVLIVVLAMLVLFAVLGLSFVLYSEAQLSAARGVKQSRNEETEPNPQQAAEGWMGPFIYDVNDTGDDLMNPIRGNSLARSKYSLPGGLLPFTASTAFPQEAVTVAGVPFADSRQIVRFTFDPANGGGVFDPERVYGATPVRTNAAAAVPGTYQGKNFPFTYPDRHDFYLAYQDPTSGRVVVPSFHREGVFGTLAPTNPNWTSPQGKLLTLRPRPGAIDGHVNFPPVPPNADGSYTGDVANMKFITGSQQNDSLWMDAGGPVLKWRGKFYKAMVAPLVLDLSGRVNLSVAGNLRNTNNTLTGVYPHGSNQGWGPWEVNPRWLGNATSDPTFNTTFTDTDLTTLVQRRYGTSATPQVDPYTGVASTTRINRGFQPPLSSRIDPDGNGPNAGDTAMTLPLPPPADGYTLYPGFASTRFAPDQATTATWNLTARLQNHPAQFNPLLPARQAISATTPTGGLGLDALAATASRHSTGVNKRPLGYGYGVPGLAPTPDTANAQLVRSLVTAFSTSQEFRTVTVTNADNTTRTVLGPVDLNRPLPDYRKDPTQPYSAVNMWDLTVAADLTAYRTVQFSRQTLAHDIYLRLAASLAGGIGGNVAGSAGYDPTTGYLVYGDPIGTGNYNIYKSMAQLAVNLVDYLDGDDVATVFVWNPATPGAADPLQDPLNFATAADLANRVVYGTEQPRLVINEAYCGIFNDKTERMLAAPNLPSKTPKRQYWVELHNPTPANDPARADAGAARLQYVPGQGGYPMTAPRFNPYRVEVATVPAGTVDAYTTAISSVVPGSGVPITNPAIATTAIGASVVLQAQVNQYTDATANPFVAGAANDEGNLVRPATATSGTSGQNVGYYLLGPDDQFLATTPPLNTVGLATPPDLTPTPAQNTLAVDAAGAIWTSDADANTEAQKTNVVILRRLANPYLPANDPNEAGYVNTLPVNQYITVDYMENLPTADRVNFLKNLATRTHTPAAGTNDYPTTGRVHPFAHGTGPNLTAGVGDGLVFQGAPNAIPPHTFFSVNFGARNNNGTTGFYWLPHLDREAVNATETFWATLDSPAGRTRVVTYDPVSGAQNTPQVYRRKVDFDNNRSPRGHVFGLLTTGPRLPGSAVGGREAGRVNLNTVNHQSVLNALLDPQAGNAFAADATLSTQAWGFVNGPTAGARTPTGVPGPTAYESGVATDDSPFWLTGTGLLYSTRLRMTGSPTTYSFGSYAATTPAHDYFQTEPLRKVWNSTTTVSDSFLVVMTVGFFEVENAGPWNVTNQPVLGRELFDKVPGDLRAQFAGVVDRSCLTVADPQAAPTTPGAAAPFQTKLTADVTRTATAIEIEAVPPTGTIPTGFIGAGNVVPANTCAILGNGEVLYVTAGTRLWVGYGNSYDTTAPGDGEWLTVGATITANVAKPGTATVTVAATTRHHGGGTLVTTAAFGNPGPQVGVTLPQLKQRGLVPYFTRLEP
jgi:hypothetical protein